MNKRLRELVGMIIAEGVEGYREVHELPAHFTSADLDFCIQWIYQKVSE